MALSRVDNKFITSLEGSKLFGDFPDSPSQIDGAALTGIDGVDLNSRYNLAINYFGDSIRNNKDRLSLDQGWVDTFEDASDVVDEGFNVPMATFDGTVNFLNRTTGQGNMSNMANGKECLFSCYYKSNQDGAGSGSDHDLFSIGNQNHILIRKDGHDSTNKINVYMKNTSNALVGRYKNSKTITIADGVVHILVAVKMDAASAADKCKIIITTSDGTKHTTMETINAASDSTLGFGVACPVVGGGGGALSGTIGSSGLRGRLGQVYFALEHMDIAVNANYAKFYNTHTAPKDFGSNGSLPTGNTPPIYLNNPFDTFQNNLGSGGDFNENGVLEDGGYIGDNALYSSESFSNSYELIRSYGKELCGNGSGINSTDRVAVGQCLTLTNTIINSVSFLLSKSGSATGNAYAQIRNAVGTPGSNAVGGDNILATSSPINVSALSGTYVTTNMVFPQSVNLAAGNYWIGMYYDGVSSLDIKNDSTGTAVGENASFFDSTSGWISPNSGANDTGYYLYGLKNLTLTTKGSDDIGNSPSAAPDTGHMEILMTERPASGTSVFSDTFDSDANSWENRSIRQVLSSHSASGSRIRVILTGNSAGRGKLNNVAIVERSGGTGNGVTTPTEILFGGTSGVEIPIGGTIVSDWLDYELDVAKDYLLIADIAAAPLDDIRYASTGGTISYWDTNSISYNTAAFTHTSTANTLNFIFSGVEVEVPQVLNTDIIAKMSRNGGTDYSNVTLTRTKTQVMGTDYNMLVGEADFTDGDATGTNIIGKIYTANKDKITVTGVSVNWK